MIKGNAVEPSANPYQSPKTPSDPSSTGSVGPRISWRRGLLLAVAGGLYGYYIPLVVVFGISWLLGIPVWRNPFHTIWGEFIAGPEAYLACSVLCAFSALLNYTPARPIGMISALRQVGTYAIIGLLLGMVLFDLLPGTPTIAYSPFRPVVAAAILLTTAVGGIYLTLQRVKKERADLPGPHTAGH